MDNRMSTDHHQFAPLAPPVAPKEWRIRIDKGETYVVTGWKIEGDILFMALANGDTQLRAMSKCGVVDITPI
jgi:hypothetical protein